MATISTHSVLCLRGIPWIELRNTSTGNSAAAFRRDRFKVQYLLAKPSPEAWTTICNPGSLGPDLQKANQKWRWGPELLSPVTARLSVLCVLALSPSGSSSSVHGRGCCKKRHPNIESLKRSLWKAVADFPIDVLRNLIDEWTQRLKDCVHANGGHFG